MADEAIELAERLTERHQMVLTGEGWAGGLEWPEVVALARKPEDSRAMSFRQMVQPLIDKGLICVARESRYVAETKDFIPKLFALTPLGIEVRAALRAHGDKA